jgi:hypothetical protein
MPSRPRLRAVAAHPALALSAALFGAIARRRRARGLHPDGAAWAATVRVRGGGWPGVPLLDVPGEHRAVVRLSRAAGLPVALPDGLGLAVRIPDAHGPGSHQDLLVTSTVRAPLLQHLPLPTAAGFLGTVYTSLVPYRLGGRLRLVAARPAGGPRGRKGGELSVARAAAAAGRARFELCAATLAGRWTPLAEVVLDAELSEAENEALAFDPVHAGGGIRPCAPLMGIRHAAYRASQAQRARARLG